MFGVLYSIFSFPLSLAPLNPRSQILPLPSAVRFLSRTTCHPHEVLLVGGDPGTPEQIRGLYIFHPCLQQPGLRDFLKKDTRNSVIKEFKYYPLSFIN